MIKSCLQSTFDLGYLSITLCYMNTKMTGFVAIVCYCNPATDLLILDSSSILTKQNCWWFSRIRRLVSNRDSILKLFYIPLTTFQIQSFNYLSCPQLSNLSVQLQVSWVSAKLTNTAVKVPAPKLTTEDISPGGDHQLRWHGFESLHCW